VIHYPLIIAPAACAIAAFVLGLSVVWRPAEQLTGLFRAYLGALGLMVLFLVGAVVVDWPDLETVRRLVYAGLLALVAYTVWRGWQAALNLEQHHGAWRDAYVENVGFTLISLFDGFVMVSAIDLGSPIWLVVAIGVLGILVGRLGVLRLKARTTGPATVLAR
jgi:uncharacterized PurR-regulated membrane protein YhhQ (DUF165 family)